MKILTILGSPRKKGNTNWALTQFEKAVSEKHDVERINIISHDIKGCLGCDRCQETPDKPGCIQKDDALMILDKVIEADVVVQSTPLYCWDYSAQMKALVDRHYCLVKQGKPYVSLIKDKPMALLVTCAGPIDGNADLIPKVFERMNGYCQAKTIGTYTIPGCATPDEMGEEAQKVVDVLTADILAMAD